jgi:hypothetical protein
MVLISVLWTLLLRGSELAEAAGAGGGGGAGGGTPVPYVGRCMTSFCRDGWVRSMQIGDEYCDMYCMTPFCGWDSPDGTFENSDCFVDCSYSGCDTALLGDGNCDSGKSYSACNTYYCAFDKGDCSYCADGCVKLMLRDGKVQTACENPQCNYDGGDAGYCASGCTQALLANNVCDVDCLTEECGYDKPACKEVTEGSHCFEVMIGDHECDNECNIAAANWDGGDCNCALGCDNEMQHNNVCDNECANQACNWDNHVCVRVM